MLVFHYTDKKLPYFSYFEKKIEKLLKMIGKRGRMGQPVKNGRPFKKCTLGLVPLNIFRRPRVKLNMCPSNI